MYQITKKMVKEMSKRIQQLSSQGVKVAQNVNFMGCNGRSDGSYRCGGGK